MSTISSTTTTLEQAYRRIRPDLEKVERIIRDELTSDRPEVAELCRHLSRFHGKMLRPALLLLTARATGGVKDIHLGLSAVLEMFHLATLIHDDILDEAGTRRQVDTINSRWGNESAVMLGDWLISHAYHLATRQGSPWASLEISQTSHRVCEGELMQLARRGRLDLSVEDYLRLIELKTATLTGLAARLGAHFNDVAAPVESACLEYGTALGMAFQITDDVLDLVGDEVEVGKTLGSDLAKGKATLPLIQCLNNGHAREAARLRDLLADPACCNTSAVRRLLADAGCIASAEAVARDYVQAAKSAADALPAGEACTALKLVADFVLVRSR
ncbi:MAG: Heptaprenyl diphosphate synthase component 2 [Phycisphaerae bacterium]|nr:Heptaprenyl diphosphate synthase component 2 [Phycisphaerae bacterium]